MAANTDHFKKGARRFSTTLSASITDSDATIGLTSTTGLPTDTAIEITVDRVSAAGILTPTTEEIVTGVVSGTNLITCLRGTEGTAQAHAAGAVVEIRLTANQWNDVVDGILEEHEQDGSHTSSFVETVMPVATILEFAGTSAPSGFVMCNGAAISRSTYSGLYSVVTTTYGEGDGSSTFNVPDKRNRTSFGAGDSYALGAEVGSATKTIAEANMPSHRHTGPSHNHTWSDTSDEKGAEGYVSFHSQDGRGPIQSVNSPFTGTQLSGYNRPGDSFSSATSYNRFNIDTRHTHSVSGTTSSNGTGNTGTKGGGTAMDVINPGLATNFIIKT